MASVARGFDLLSVHYTLNKEFLFRSCSSIDKEQNAGKLLCSGCILHRPSASNNINFVLMNVINKQKFRFSVIKNFNLLKPTGHVMHQQFNI